MAAAFRSTFLFYGTIRSAGVHYSLRKEPIPARVLSLTSSLRRASINVAQQDQKSVNAIGTEQVKKSTKSRKKFIRRVKTETRKEMNQKEYKNMYKRLHRKLSKCKNVKSTLVNIILYNTKHAVEMKNIKSLLHLLRKSGSLMRDSVSSVVVTTCLRLGVPYEALEIITDPVKYGIFPPKQSLKDLMNVFSELGDLESFEKVCEIRARLEPKVFDFEVKARVAVRTNALINRLKKKKVDTKKVPPGDIPLKQEAIDSTTTSETSVDVKCSETTQKSEHSAIEGSDISATDGVKEELDYILQLCYEQFLEEPPPFMYYYVTEKLMEHGSFSLANYVIGKLQDKKDLPTRMPLNMQLDYHRLQSEYAETLKILKVMKDAKELPAKTKELSLQAFFENCPDPNMKKSFEDLNLKRSQK